MTKIVVTKVYVFLRNERWLDVSLNGWNINSISKEKNESFNFSEAAITKQENWEKTNNAYGS